jgi:hypothetical protein
MDEDEAGWMPAYEGPDLAGYILSQGMRFPQPNERLVSISNVRDCAVIVTDGTVYIAKPYSGSGFILYPVAMVR